MLVAKDEVHPVVQTLGDKFTLKRFSLDANEVFGGGGPGGEGDVVDDLAVLGGERGREGGREG